MGSKFKPVFCCSSYFQQGNGSPTYSGEKFFKNLFLSMRDFFSIPKTAKLH